VLRFNVEYDGIQDFSRLVGYQRSTSGRGTDKRLNDAEKV
jgi:hypothetical protein